MQGDILISFIRITGIYEQDLSFVWQNEARFFFENNKNKKSLILLGTDTFFDC